MTTKVVMLGTGTPNPDPDRMGSAVAIVTRRRALLVDFGPGVVRRAAQAAARGMPQLDPARLDLAFATHLHSDHTAGYADLILTPWVVGRRAPIEVFGPRGIAHMTEHLLEAYAADRTQRVCGLEPIDRDAFGAIAHEIAPGRVFEDDEVRVDAFAVDHGETWDAFGYRFETEDRVVVVSGDTRPTAALVDACRECDVLVHEVYSAAAYARRPPEWRRYHAAMHTSTEELARIASEIRPRRLVLTHQLTWGTDEASLLAEVRSGYEGEVISARDLDVI